METKEKVIEEPYGFIYITTNMVNGMRYLGRRKIGKDNSWIRYLGSGSIFRRALKKYGKENFSRNIVCFCYSEEELNKAEYDLSVLLNVVEDENWYNLCYGGGATSGYHHSEESKRKMSQNSIPSEETREKMRISAKARCTDEWRQKMSEMNKGKWSGKNNPNYGNHNRPYKNNLSRKNKDKNNKSTNNKNKKPSNWSRENNPRHIRPLVGKDNPMFGKTHSEETREKISKNRKGKLTGKDNGRARAIVQLTKDGEFIRKWDYITLAADFLGVKPWNIITCCSHPDKLKTAYGFKWMYEEDYLKLTTKQND